MKPFEPPAPMGDAKALQEAKEFLQSLGEDRRPVDDLKRDFMAWSEHREWGDRRDFAANCRAVWYQVAKIILPSAEYRRRLLQSPENRRYRPYEYWRALSERATGRRERIQRRLSHADRLRFLEQWYRTAGQFEEIWRELEKGAIICWAPGCGNIVPPDRVIKRKARYCSEECRVKAKKNRSRARHPETSLKANQRYYSSLALGEELKQA